MGKQKDPLDDMSEQLTLAAHSGGAAFPPELAVLLQRKLARELAKQDQDEEELRRLLAARSEAFKQEIEGRKRAQEFCPHRKEDNRSRIGGQRLSDGTVLYLCQYCAKEWRGTELPPSLAIPFELVGG
jgi:hypothetical protein